MIIRSPDLRAVGAIRANLPGAGGRQPLAVRRPGHVFHPTASDVDSPAYLTFGDTPDQDPAVLAGRGERGSARVDRRREHAAFMNPLPCPGGRAGLAVERVDATRGVTDRQRLTAQAPTPGDGVVADLRRPAPAKNTLRAADVQIRHASNPCRMPCSSRLRPMNTS